MYNKFRDVLEKQVYKVAFDNNIKMVGICRGLQFLTAMAGGKLMHHIENHGGCNHVMHLAEEWEGKKSIVVNSYHHQMCLPPKNSVVLGYAPKKLANGYYFGDKDELTTWTGADVEAMYLPNINAFGVQWHPEMLQTKSEGYVWFNTMVDLFLNNEGIFSNKLKYKEAGA